MRRLRDEQDLQGLCDRAGEILDVPAGVVEKDYWVAQALRTLAATYPNEFIFKGGTSLSKGFELIQRFSEDIDILVRDRGILGGIDPQGSQFIGTLIGDVLAAEPGINKTDFDDLAPFWVPVLHPARTLMEKLMLVNTVVARHAGDPEQLRDQRIARHFYDIHCLLGHGATCDLLANRDAFANVLADAERISAQHFGGVEPRPDGGFADSDAFAARPGLRDVLAADYEDTMSGYYFGSDPHPSFDEVCQRVETHRGLL